MMVPLRFLDDQRVRFSSANASALVDLARPEQGFFQLEVGGCTLRDATLLGISPHGNAQSAATLPLESHARGQDLVASYRPEFPPVLVDVLWHPVNFQPTGESVALLEVVVSVRSEQLESQPALAVESALPCGEVLRIAMSETRVAAIELADMPAIMRPGEPTGCLLFRLPGGAPSYVEMIHPADFMEDRVDRSVTSLPRCVKVAHRLFPEPLEKGVLLRARVRGAFVPREDDVRLAAACFASFAASEPPLAT